MNLRRKLQRDHRLILSQAIGQPQMLEALPERVLESCLKELQVDVEELLAESTRTLETFGYDGCHLLHHDRRLEDAAPPERSPIRSSFVSDISKFRITARRVVFSYMKMGWQAFYVTVCFLSRCILDRKFGAINLRRPAIMAMLVISFFYAAYPFITLYRLRSAVRNGDTPTLALLVDWYSVREGIKEDICDLVLEEAGDVANGGRLPAFGVSFVRGVTGSSVDREFTPANMTSIVRAAADNHTADASIEWAFFTGPGQFSAAVQTEAARQPIRIRFDFSGTRWQVSRVWLPDKLLVRAGTAYTDTN